MISLRQFETKSVLEHISELRKKLLLVVAFFVVGAVVAHFFHEKIIYFLLQYTGGQELIFLSPLDPIFFILKIDFIGGVVISFPVIMWGIFSYITPAFSPKTRSLLFFFFITSVLLLMVGLSYAFLVTIPFSLKFLLSIIIPGIQNQISAQNYISFLIAQAFIIMMIFQIPELIIGGVYIRALKTKMLSEKRRHIYLVTIIALSILTPTADVFNLGIVLIPCLVIFEVSLVGAKVVERLKKRI